MTSLFWMSAFGKKHSQQRTGCALELWLESRKILANKAGTFLARDLV